MALRGARAPGSLADYAGVLLRYDQVMGAGDFTPDGRLRRLKQWLSLSNALQPERVGSLFDRVKVQREHGSALAMLEAIA